MQQQNDDSYEEKNSDKSSYKISSIKDLKSKVLEKSANDSYEEEIEEDEDDDFTTASTDLIIVKEDYKVGSKQELVEYKNTTSVVDKIITNNTMMNSSYTRGQNTYNQKMQTYQVNEWVQTEIAYFESNKYHMINSSGSFLVDEINKDGQLCLWKYKQDFYYRHTQNSKIDNGNKNKMSQIIGDFRGKIISIVSSKDITKNGSITHNKIENYILTHQIPVIDSEIFDPREKSFFQKDEVWYKNKFEPSEHLQKRFDYIEKIDYFDCFIIDFFENIAGENNHEDNKKEITVTILRWFSSYLQTMRSSRIALVLNGSKEIEKLFWEKLIKPIFGYEQYCVTIDDQLLQKPLAEIVAEKVFFHIVDFTPTKENIQKIDQLLQAILIDKYVLTESHPQKRVPVFGQAFITADETLSYMKEYHSLFEYVSIKDGREVISNLAEGIKDLTLKFNEKELDTFSTCLAIFDKHFNENNELSVVSKITQKAEEETLENKIEAFIQSIKDRDAKKYFKKLEEIPELYEELKFAFDKNCFIGQNLAEYFNIVHNKNIFENNTQLLKLLKEKDKMFTQELTILKALDENAVEQVLFKGITTYREVKNKKLYKIDDYSLPEDIEVPINWIITNREGNQRFKYNHEDMASAKKIHKEYDEKKS